MFRNYQALNALVKRQEKQPLLEYYKLTGDVTDPLLKEVTKEDLHELVNKQYFRIVTDLFNENLLTVEMLEPNPGERSVFALLIDANQFEIANLLLENGLVTKTQAADTSTFRNAVGLLAEKQEWKFLLALMSSNLISLNSFFKKPLCESNAITQINCHAHPRFIKQINAYCFEAVKSSIENKDIKTVTAWLDFYISTYELEKLKSILKFKLENLAADKNNFAEKMSTLDNYLRQLQRTNIKDKQSFIEEIIKDKLSNESKEENNDSVYSWINSNTEVLKKYFIIKRHLLPDNKTAWENLIDNINTDFNTKNNVVTINSKPQP